MKSIYKDVDDGAKKLKIMRNIFKHTFMSEEVCKNRLQRDNFLCHGYVNAFFSHDEFLIRTIVGVVFQLLAMIMIGIIMKRSLRITWKATIFWFVVHEAILSVHDQFFQPLPLPWPSIILTLLMIVTFRLLK